VKEVKNALYITRIFKCHNNLQQNTGNWKYSPLNRTPVHVLEKLPGNEIQVHLGTAFFRIFLPVPDNCLGSGNLLCKMVCNCILRSVTGIHCTCNTFEDNLGVKTVSKPYLIEMDCFSIFNLLIG